MTHETLATEKEKRYATSTLCGKCLHARESHEKHNGHFMFCACCRKLCDIDDFLKVHRPTEESKLYEISAAREYSKYNPKGATQIE